MFWLHTTHLKVTPQPASSSLVPVPSRLMIRLSWDPVEKFPRDACQLFSRVLNVSLVGSALPPSKCFDGGVTHTTCAVVVAAPILKLCPEYPMLSKPARDNAVFTSQTNRALVIGRPPLPRNSGPGRDPRAAMNPSTAAKGHRGPPVRPIVIVHPLRAWSVFDYLSLTLMRVAFSKLSVDTS